MGILGLTTMGIEVECTSLSAPPVRRDLYALRPGM